MKSPPPAVHSRVGRPWCWRHVGASIAYITAHESRPPTTSRSADFETSTAYTRSSRFSLKRSRNSPPRTSYRYACLSHEPTAKALPSPLNWVDQMNPPYLIDFTGCSASADGRPPSAASARGRPSAASTLTEGNDPEAEAEESVDCADPRSDLAYARRRCKS